MPDATPDSALQIRAIALRFTARAWSVAPPEPMRAIFRVATVLMLVLSLGLHWALLQTAAWTGMIIAYSQDAPLLTAVAQTFDGNHPCPMCKAIKQGRAEERKRDQQKQSPDTDLKLKLSLPGEDFVLIAPVVLRVWVSPRPLPHSISTEPPTPPPRVGAV
jgi:hypothetical protein